MRSAETWIALALSTALFLAVVIATVNGVEPSWLHNATMALERDGADTHFATNGELHEIAVRNGAIALFLFSGVITAGISTVIALTLVAFSIGTTMSAVGHAGGWSRLVSDVVLYAPFEFASFCICAAAGLLPLMSSITTRRPQHPTAGRAPQHGFSRYVTAFPRALMLGGIGVAGVVLAASVEAIVIGSR